MAGMIPGVESARRRRFHGSSVLDSPASSSSSGSGYGYGSSTRRSSFCLYTSNHESHLSSTSSSHSHLQQRSMVKQAYQDEKLGGVAREAKERLDMRLRTQYRKSEPKRTNSQEIYLRGVEGLRSNMVVVDRDLHTEPEVSAGLKKSTSSGSKRFNWAKLSWKASEQDECAVCLEQFKAGETLAHLPCAHRFHSRCLVPWLENNAHCPCCRMGI